MTWIAWVWVSKLRTAGYLKKSQEPTRGLRWIRKACSIWLVVYCRSGAASSTSRPLCERRTNGVRWRVERVSMKEEEGEGLGGVGILIQKVKAAEQIFFKRG